MPSPVAQHSVTLDNTFDPYVAGTTKAGATGVFENGVDICNLYANIIYGTAAAATGITCRTPAVDLSAIFAKKGTATYALPFDGANFSINSQSRGSAYLHVTMKSDGTFTVYTFNSGALPQTVVRFSGTWLPAGESVANWSVQFAASLGTDHVIGDADNYITNGAPSISALTTTRDCEGGSSAPVTGGDANATGGITVKLYRLGVLKSTSAMTFSTNVNGQ